MSLRPNYLLLAVTLVAATAYGQEDDGTRGLWCGGEGEPCCITGNACDSGLICAGLCVPPCVFDPCGSGCNPVCNPACSAFDACACSPGPCNPDCPEFDACICAGTPACVCDPCGPTCSPECNPVCSAFDLCECADDPCNPDCPDFDACTCAGADPCFCDPCGPTCTPECNPLCSAFEIDACIGVPNPDCDPPTYPTPTPVHVNVGGSVTPDGTSASPYPSVQAGACRAQPGQAVSLAAGDYREAFTWESPVTLTATGGTATIGRTTGVTFTTLKVMTYNTHLFGQTMTLPLPPPFSPVTFEDFADAQRAALLASRIAVENADVVGLTEVWDVDLANIIVSNAGYPHYYYSTALDENIKQLNSGLLLLCKYPLSGATITYYDDYYAEDMFASKGFVSASFQKAGMTFGVFLTHMQSLADTGAMAARRLQLIQLDSAVDAFQAANPAAEVFVMGDLNVPGESCEYYDNLVPIMQRADAHRAAPCFALPAATYNPSLNDLISVFTDDTEAERLDYILYNHNSGRVSVPLSAQIKMYQTSPPINEAGESASHLCDHFGLMAEFRVFQ